MREQMKYRNRRSTPFTLILIIPFLLLISAGKVELLKEASFYTKLKKNFVRCDLCPIRCIIEPGKTGNCNVRQNIDGTLYSLVYNQLITYHIDPIEKKPLYHFYPGSKILSIATAGCNLRCNFCQNWEISQSKPDEVPTYNMTPEDIVALARKNDCPNIAFTYTEPTVFYEYMLDIARLAGKEDIKTVWVTCGYINEEPLRKLLPWLDAANIDLKGFSEEFYQTYTTGKLQPVLDCIRICSEENLFFEITNLVIPKANDDPEMIREMCEWIVQTCGKDTPVHFSRFHPDYKLLNRPATPLKTLLKAKDIAREAGLQYVYIGNIQTDFEDTICPNCGTRVIDRSGYLIRENRIIDGKCPECRENINGCFDIH